MSYWDSYTRIEGLEFLGDFDLSYESYEFDLVGVWKGADGYYVSTDSGCSCPTPWEWVSSEDSLTGPMSRDEMIESVRGCAVKSVYDYDLEEYVDGIKYEEDLMEWISELP